MNKTMGSSPTRLTSLETLILQGKKTSIDIKQEYENENGLDNRQEIVTARGVSVFFFREAILKALIENLKDEDSDVRKVRKK